MSLVLGVDVGSQSIKAVIVDEGGDVVSSGSAPLTMVHEHDGWADQDPYTYCTALRDAVRAATEGVQADRIVAMGLGSQVDGVVACDADGAPLRSGDHLAGQAGHQAVRPAGLGGGVRTARRADRTGGRCVAQRTEDDVDPRARTAGLAAGGRAGAGRDRMCCTTFRARTPRMRRTRRRRWCTTSPRAISTPSCVRRPGSTRRCCRRCAPRRRWSAHCGPTSPLNSGCRPRARLSSAPETNTPRPSGRAPSSPESSSTSPAPPNR